MKNFLNTDITGEYKAPDKIWNKMFISIFFANMALNLGQQMSNSMLSLYADSIGAPASEVGLLMSMFAITALIFRFVAGPAINSFNRVLLEMAAMALMGVAYLGFAFSTGIHGLMFFRLIQGVGQAFGNSVCLALVAEVLPKDKFGTGMGYYACAQVVSQAIGPTVGDVVKNAVGYRALYIITACFMIVAVLSASLVKTPPRKKVKFSLTLNNMIAKEAIVPALVCFCIAMGYTVINAFLLLYASKRGIEGASLFFTVYAVTMLITRPTVGKLTDRFGFAKVAFPCALLTAASIALIGISTSLPMLLIAAVTNAFGYGAIQPALQSLALKSVTNDRRGSASGTYYIGMDTATILGPTLSGMVANAFGYTPVMWTVMTIPIIVGALVIIFARKRIHTIENEFAERTKD